ncbi:MAG: isoleucine--tRNA ligase, partial [Mycobacteriales bacterium]
FKDIFPRLKTMQGYHVPRKAGWDCHGLPVEVAVEKELGFTGKADIERYGIAAFNDKCRASVQAHVDEFVAMTKRMGYWVDLERAYQTMSPEYVDSVWWSLKQIFDAGLLDQGFRVAPYCPRCGTGLSDHEVAQGYEDVTDPSVYVRFPLTSGPWAGKADLLVWTTTPWTLVSNTAVAVHPDVVYVVARTDVGMFVVAEALLEQALGADAHVIARMRGRELEKLTYRPPFSLVEVPDAHIVVLARYVSTQDGTGLVHQAPAFGADDLEVCRGYGLPVVNPIDAGGHFAAEVPLVGGQFFKDADVVLVADLTRRGLLLRKLDYEHSYPHCWRCHTPLMYYAQRSWYIRTTELKDALLAENERTNWYPERVKHGRYGDWLNNNVDWALSRERYWGTPLPIWRCESGHLTVVGSRAELGELTGRDLSTLDPHRPYVDEITFDCPRCGADSGGQSSTIQPSTATRVSEVIDAWYDSGAMPFAQWGYPHAPGSVEAFERAYPAQYICEAIDQTRGWFYSLMAVGTAVFGRSSYQNVVCLGHILAEDGRKMSKHLGNIVEPMPLMDQHGADVLRWFMLCAGSPWAARRIGDNTLQETARKTLVTYWHTASFFTLYAATAQWGERRSPQGVPEPQHRPLLDRWLLAELRSVASDVSAALQGYDTAGAGRRLSQFIDVLSNWYVRRSRNRFWSAEPACLATLHECLELVTRLLAPFVPFVTERVWQAVVRPVDADAPESVHLAAWPTPAEYAPRPGDEQLRAQMALVRQVVEAGRSARTAAKIRIRQPLARAMVSGAGGELLDSAAGAATDDAACHDATELRSHVLEELNVTELAPLSQAGDLVDVTLKPNFRTLGRRFGSQTQVVASAITAVGTGDTAVAGVAALRGAGELELTVGDTTVTVTPDEVIITETPRTGWAVVSEHGVTVALDTEITPQLRRAGAAREAIRFIQEERKNLGLEITDRIRLWWKADAETAQAITEHADHIADAVLAVEFWSQPPNDPEADALSPRVAAELGLCVWLVKA